MRKHILASQPSPAVPAPGELDVAAIATVWVTSESKTDPIEKAFDACRGPGGSRWVAETPGEQTLILAFDEPRTIRQVELEVEEKQIQRTQELQLAVSQDGGQNYRELRRQEYNFAPPDTTFEREIWDLNLPDVSHLRLILKPDKGNPAITASLTALILK